MIQKLCNISALPLAKSDPRNALLRLPTCLFGRQIPSAKAVNLQNPGKIALSKKTSVVPRTPPLDDEDLALAVLITISPFPPWSCARHVVSKTRNVVEEKLTGEVSHSKLQERSSATVQATNVRATPDHRPIPLPQQKTSK